MASAKVAHAAVMSPADHAVRARKPAAAPRTWWSPGPASVHARRAWASVAAASPRACASEAR